MWAGVTLQGESVNESDGDRVGVGRSGGGRVQRRDWLYQRGVLPTNQRDLFWGQVVGNWFAPRPNWLLVGQLSDLISDGCR